MMMCLFECPWEAPCPVLWVTCPALGVPVNCCARQAYDEHLNMVLGDVEETITTTEQDEETMETIIKVGGRVG